MDGQSELDSVALKVPSLDLELRTWQSYSIRQDFLTPASAFDFVFATNKPSLYDEVFLDGTEVQITVNSKPQLTGVIEKVTTSADRGSGTVFRVSGRDFLGPVVSASIDPQTKITANQTVFDFLSLVLAPYGIDKIEVGAENNTSIVTGNITSRSIMQASKSRIKTPSSTLNNGAITPQYGTKTVTQVVSPGRTDLKTLQLDQLKPKIGDGAMQVIERLLTRLGLQMFASADGSGVVVDRPDYTTAPIHRLVRQFDGDGSNNIINGTRVRDGEIQPCCVLATGKSSGADMASARLKCIAVNEFVACDSRGNIAAHVQDIIARYPGILVLPIRERLLPRNDRLVSRRKPVPLIVKDDESKTNEQLQAFTRRKLAELQRKYFTVTYTVKGHTYGDKYPYAVNTNVDIDDDHLGIHDTLWTMGRTFTKSRDAGTMTELTMIRPYTLELGT